MNDSSIPLAAAAAGANRRRTMLGVRIRYWRIGIVCAVVYGALLVVVDLVKYSGTTGRLLGALIAAVLFGVLMAALFAYFERKALARLNIDADTAEDNGIFKPDHSAVVELNIAGDDALRRATEALADYGAVIVKQDPAGRRVEAVTAQSWQGYGEVVTISIAGSYPCEVTIRAAARMFLFKWAPNYGRSWEHIRALTAHITTGEFPVAAAPAAGTSLCAAAPGNTPPAVMEAGAWQRLLALAAMYALLLPGMTKAGKTELVVGAFVLGVAVELAAFLWFRLQVQRKLRSDAQEDVESMLNNLWPAVFTPVLLFNPAQAWTDGGNIASVVVAAIFAVMAASRLRERSREREQRQLIQAGREKAELQRQLAEARLVALSAQIEPHFLFNTLASIQYLIRHDAGKAADMTSDLIRYLRLALPRMKQATARLADELDLVRAYLGIMQIRMGARLQFTVDSPGQAADCAVPTMALITLVENAIKHGLEQKADGGSIFVSLQVGSDMLRLEVADTGGGFSTAASGTGIGLANIRERLETLYGDRASLALEANQPSGVRAILTIPKESA